MNPSILGVNSPSIKNLYKWLGVLDLKIVSFSNIYSEFGQFNNDKVERNYLSEVCPNYNKILALGTKVGDVLDLMHISHFKLPHPSGRNRQLNDSKFIESKLKECKSYVGGNV